MKIELHEIPLRDIAAGYRDDAESGCIGYGGQLNIRPAFQREFVYSDKRRDAVIDTIIHGFPLNSMYWTIGDGGIYEMLDGQQRTISACQYVNNEFSIIIDGMPRKFDNLTADEKEAILSYPFMIYVCEGTDKEKLDWFKIINIAGEKLTAQELRNAIYSGPWLSDAKRHFSKTGCPAYQIGSDYVAGVPIRQAFLETALRWICDRDGITIEEYMSAHQQEPSCNELWLYFQGVINWVRAVFPVYRPIMKGIEWGVLYNKYGKNSYNPAALEEQVSQLLMDDDISKQKGIYEYLLGGEEKCLAIRRFSPAMARAAYERQGGVCPRCGKKFALKDMQADHITPWSKGGHTDKDNCQMLCADCNRRKSNI